MPSIYKNKNPLGYCANFFLFLSCIFSLCFSPFSLSFIFILKTEHQALISFTDESFSLGPGAAWKASPITNRSSLEPETQATSSPTLTAYDLGPAPSTPKPTPDLLGHLKEIMWLQKLRHHMYYSQLPRDPQTQLSSDQNLLTLCTCTEHVLVFSLSSSPSQNCVTTAIQHQERPEKELF